MQPDLEIYQIYFHVKRKTRKIAGPQFELIDWDRRFVVGNLDTAEFFYNMFLNTVKGWEYHKNYLGIVSLRRAKIESNGHLWQTDETIKEWSFRND